MKTTSESRAGRASLMVAHCAGMVDLVALPVWVGVLISGYGLDPQQAGGLATLFLAGAVCASLFVAPRSVRVPARATAAGGFAVAALAFGAVGLVDGYAAMAVLHVVAGLAAATALSVTHATIGGSGNPHRLFAIVGFALGVFGILFMGGVPKLVAALGAPALFWSFCGIMAFAACVAALAFPTSRAASTEAQRMAGKLPRAVWLAAIGVSCMALVQAMIFAFVERIGAERGFDAAAVAGVLIALGFVNLLPAPLAAFLQQRVNPRVVLVCGPVVQAVLALLMTQSQTVLPYAAGAACFAAVMIFTHTFAFGLLAALDPSGRAVGATPAMLMTGAAIGPILGGTVVKLSGYASLGLAAAAIAACAVVCFLPGRADRALLTHS
ncbi:MFS transporter [Pseudoduganella albidiflava]|uniref:MFS transporter n=1 Tax=Pseudoduganella albidiflava TaxID=321983 RepID=A0A411X0B4_9BURK|nr:MFS transporter [Pseudoduganella albidiflava]QBI02400.1 MFS transporter [Pseudoduganella albidiflava]GGY43125.1 MFS transporter [Pseudoduganella albidiflava]